MHESTEVGKYLTRARSSDQFRLWRSQGIKSKVNSYRNSAVYAIKAPGARSIETISPANRCYSLPRREKIDSALYIGE